MNRIRTVTGVIGGAAVSYGFEKLGGSVDVLDIVYSLGMGAVSGSVLAMDRQEVYDPDFWRQCAAEDATQQQPDTPPEPLIV